MTMMMMKVPVTTVPCNENAVLCLLTIPSFEEILLLQYKLASIGKSEL